MAVLDVWMEGDALPGTKKRDQKNEEYCLKTIGFTINVMYFGLGRVWLNEQK